MDKEKEIARDRTYNRRVIGNLGCVSIPVPVPLTSMRDVMEFMAELTEAAEIAFPDNCLIESFDIDG